VVVLLLLSVVVAAGGGGARWREALAAPSRCRHGLAAQVGMRPNVPQRDAPSDAAHSLRATPDQRL
jgi:hypothetical protein